MYITSEKLKNRIDEICREVNERFDRKIQLEEYIAIPYFGQIILRFMLEGEDYTLEDLDRYEQDLYRIVGDEFLVDFMGSVYRKVGVDYSDLGKIFRAMEAEYREEAVVPSVHSEEIRADARDLLKAAGMDPDQKVWEIQLEDGYYTLLLLGKENREILEMQEPVKLIVQETRETENTGLIKAAMRCKRLGVSLGRLMIEMSR
ncbi:MAG: hypothetical protein IKZ98_12955 [Clostridia bacterium]|nr:hypothetical protein [Clostridia bacterium]